MKLCLRCNQYFEDDLEQCPQDRSTLEPVGKDPLIGALINDRYAVDSVIGKGSSGIVYKATRLLMGRDVAVKVIHSYLGADTGTLDRFLREVRAAERLRHPHIITIWETGVTDDGQPYLVMDYLEGITIAELIREKGSIHPGRALPIVRQVCEALAEAHRQGIVHRDMKPENVILEVNDSAEDYAKVLDFGIADAPQENNRPQPGVAKTVAGSPAYMSPEQCQGLELDTRSDIYSLAIVVFEMLTGRRPFEDDNLTRLMSMHVYQAAPRLSEIRPDLSFPPALDAALLKALQKNKDQRQQTVRELWNDLEEGCKGTEYGRQISSKKFETAEDSQSLGIPERVSGGNEASKPSGASSIEAVAKPNPPAGAPRPAAGLPVKSTGNPVTNSNFNLPPVPSLKPEPVASFNSSASLASVQGSNSPLNAPVVPSLSPVPTPVNPAMRPPQAQPAAPVVPAAPLATPASPVSPMSPPAQVAPTPTPQPVAQVSAPQAPQPGSPFQASLPPQAPPAAPAPQAPQAPPAPPATVSGHQAPLPPSGSFQTASSNSLAPHIPSKISPLDSQLKMYPPFAPNAVPNASSPAASSPSPQSAQPSSAAASPASPSASPPASQAGNSPGQQQPPRPSSPPIAQPLGQKPQVPQQPGVPPAPQNRPSAPARYGPKSTLTLPGSAPKQVPSAASIKAPAPGKRTLGNLLAQAAPANSDTPANASPSTSASPPGNSGAPSTASTPSTAIGATGPSNSSVSNSPTAPTPASPAAQTPAPPITPTAPTKEVEAAKPISPTTRAASQSSQTGSPSNSPTPTIQAPPIAPLAARPTASTPPTPKSTNVPHSLGEAVADAIDSLLVEHGPLPSKTIESLRAANVAKSQISQEVPPVPMAKPTPTVEAVGPTMGAALAPSPTPAVAPPVSPTPATPSPVSPSPVSPAAQSSAAAASASAPSSQLQKGGQKSQLTPPPFGPPPTQASPLKKSVQLGAPANPANKGTPANQITDETIDPRMVGQATANTGVKQDLLAQLLESVDASKSQPAEPIIPDKSKASKSASAPPAQPSGDDALTRLLEAVNKAPESGAKKMPGKPKQAALEDDLHFIPPNKDSANPKTSIERKDLSQMADMVNQPPVPGHRRSQEMTVIPTPPQTPQPQGLAGSGPASSAVSDRIRELNQMLDRKNKDDSSPPPPEPMSRSLSKLPSQSRANLPGKDAAGSGVRTGRNYPPDSINSRRERDPSFSLQELQAMHADRKQNKRHQAVAQQRSARNVGKRLGEWKTPVMVTTFLVVILGVGGVLVYMNFSTIQTFLGNIPALQSLMGGGDKGGDEDVDALIKAHQLDAAMAKLEEKQHSTKLTSAENNKLSGIYIDLAKEAIQAKNLQEAREYLGKVSPKCDRMGEVRKLKRQLSPKKSRRR